RTVGIAREKRTGLAILFGDDMHRGFRPQIAEHPFHVTGHGHPARARRRIAYLQRRELNGRVSGHVHPQLGEDAVLVMLEHRVTESVPRDIRTPAACGQWRWRPEASGLLVAH